MDRIAPHGIHEIRNILQVFPTVTRLVLTKVVSYLLILMVEAANLNLPRPFVRLNLRA